MPLHEGSGKGFGATAAGGAAAHAALKLLSLEGWTVGLMGLKSMGWGWGTGLRNPALWWGRCRSLSMNVMCAET